MKNITFSADGELIEAARERARQENTTLNEAFRRWLSDYAQHREQVLEHDDVVRELRGQFRVGRRLSREEMNER